MKGNDLVAFLYEQIHVPVHIKNIIMHHWNNFNSIFMKKNEQLDDMNDISFLQPPYYKYPVIKIRESSHRNQSTVYCTMCKIGTQTYDHFIQQYGDA